MSKKDYNNFYKDQEWKQFSILEKIHLRYYLKLFKRKPETILDVGCGTGLHTAILNSERYICHGIDFSDEAITKAKNKYNEIQYEVQDAKNLDLRQKYDLFLAIGFSLFNTPDTKEIHHLLSEWYQHINQEGGIIYISKTDFSNTSPTGWYFLTHAKLHEQFDHPSYYSKIFYIHSKLGYLILTPVIGRLFIGFINFISRYIIASLFKVPVKTIIILYKKNG